jgi:hypothetical protein
MRPQAVVEAEAIALHNPVPPVQQTEWPGGRGLNHST